MSNLENIKHSAATEALVIAGDQAQAEDVAALEAALEGARAKLKTSRTGLVERMIYGPAPAVEELCSGAVRMLGARTDVADRIVDTSMGLLAAGEAFTADGKISAKLREKVAADGAYGFSVPTEFGGKGLDYSQLAVMEEDFAANGLGALAVEVSGQLTIGSSALLGYGSGEQCSTFLPLIADGTLIAFALTEVGVGVNARKVQAWVEADDEAGCWRLNAEGARNKLYITSATHGGLAAIVARKGKNSKEIGLFIVSLPSEDVDGEFGFHCSSSHVSAFGQNINSRLEFRNFPIPYDQEIQGNGVEVLFYCLRMGRCMLAAMSAGFQRMMAADALAYAQARDGVGGKVIAHELPRFGIAKILGGALTAQALSHLALAQDADGADLAGLRDLTKSASARYALDSLIACERVIGGRSLDKGSRITDARPTLHAFGVVEGEDDLIRLGMVKDVTSNFAADYLQQLLGIIAVANKGPSGEPLPAEKRIYRIGPSSMLRHPVRSLKAIGALLAHKSFWRFAAWAGKNAALDILALPLRLVPSVLLPRYRGIPGKLKAELRFAERALRRCRWLYLMLNMVYQLDLTRAQLPLQRLGKRIELLVAMAAICSHASKLDASSQRIAVLQCKLMRAELKGLSTPMDIWATARLRRSLAAVAEDFEAGRCQLLDKVAPQAWAHPWS